MSTSTNYPELEPVELTPIDMHGPIETSMRIHVITPDGQKARLTFQINPGQLPTQADLAGVLANALNGDHIPIGTRLMTKAEFVAHITERDTGQAMAMPGNPDFIPLQPVTQEQSHE